MSIGVGRRRMYYINSQMNLGKYSLVKVCSGVIKGDDVLFNVSKDSEEKLNKLYVLEGSKPIEVAELHAGDIGAIAKLGTVTTGDTLATKTTPILYGKTNVIRQ